MLYKGPNTLVIHFENNYYTDGNGIHTFTDVDKKQYLYLQTEPYYANRVYPVFDQPDLKGTMTFKIEAPKEWVIVSNTPEVPSSELGGHLLDQRIELMKQGIELPDNFYQFVGTEDTTVHQFKQTPLLPTYLFAFVAGPFKSVKYDDFDGKSVPMTIFCRETLFEFAKAQQRDIFLFCKRGIEFYESFFQSKFQFEKYDFVFCPEFNVGAMEFPGCVTFNDKYIFREVPSSNQVTTRGMVILHELAHFWFGDYVTMKWWNDLWLNESFADFACYLAMSFINNKFDFPTIDGWTMFNGRKWKGYDEDSQITTHSITGEVENTDVAESIFDGITYSKGASVLKQLYFLVSYDKFSECLKNYFKKYGFKNATLKDFLKEIENVLDNKKGPYDMAQWNKDWLGTSGHCRLSVKWDRSSRGDQELTVVQEPVMEEHKTLRFNKIRLAFFSLMGTKVGISPADVIVKNERETKFVFTNPGYQAVLPNFDDNAFLRIEIDKESREFLLQNIEGIAEKQVLNLMLIARSLFDSVTDAKYKGTQFVEDLLPKFLEKASKTAVIFENLLNLFAESLNSFTPGKDSAGVADKLFWILVELTKKYKTNGDLVKNAKGSLVKYARSEKAVDKLREILEDKDPDLKHIGFNFDELWGIVFKVTGDPKFPQEVKDRVRKLMEEKDNTDSKKYWKLALDALVADEDKTKQLWETISSEKRQESYTEMTYIFKGLNSSYRDIEKRKPYHELFFKSVIPLIEKDLKINADTYFKNGLPNVEDFDYLISKTKELDSQLGDQYKFFKILFKKQVSNWERRKKAHALYN